MWPSNSIDALQPARDHEARVAEREPQRAAGPAIGTQIGADVALERQAALRLEVLRARRQVGLAHRQARGERLEPQLAVGAQRAVQVDLADVQVQRALGLDPAVPALRAQVDRAQAEPAPAFAQHLDLHVAHDQRRECEAAGAARAVADARLQRAHEVGRDAREAAAQHEGADGEALLEVEAPVDLELVHVHRALALPDAQADEVDARLEPGEARALELQRQRAHVPAQLLAQHVGQEPAALERSQQQHQDEREPPGAEHQFAQETASGSDDRGHARLAAGELPAGLARERPPRERGGRTHVRRAL
jgi:hypothetical protein